MVIFLWFILFPFSFSDLQKPQFELDGKSMCSSWAEWPNGSLSLLLRFYFFLSFLFFYFLFILDFSLMWHHPSFLLLIKIWRILNFEINSAILWNPYCHLKWYQHSMRMMPLVPEGLLKGLTISRFFFPLYNFYKD